MTDRTNGREGQKESSWENSPEEREKDLSGGAEREERDPYKVSAKGSSATRWTREVVEGSESRRKRGGNRPWTQ